MERRRDARSYPVPGCSKRTWPDNIYPRRNNHAKNGADSDWLGVESRLQFDVKYKKSQPPAVEVI